MRAFTPLRPLAGPVRTILEARAYDTGWRIDEGEEPPGWLERRSPSAPGRIWIAGAAGGKGPWALAVEDKAVARALENEPAPIKGPGAVRFVLADERALAAAMGRLWQLSKSLPEAPLTRFREELKKLPATTEADATVRRRIGQDIFRTALDDYWQGRCPMTGITTRELLRASHIVPWSECESDEERLDVFNGLLLSALWDAAFDQGLVSFADDGRVLASDRLDDAARMALGLDKTPRLPVAEAHKPYLARHRRRNGFGQEE